jgi:hypothetical protein
MYTVNVGDSRAIMTVCKHIDVRDNLNDTVLSCNDSVESSEEVQGTHLRRLSSTTKKYESLISTLPVNLTDLKLVYAYLLTEDHSLDLQRERQRVDNDNFVLPRQLLPYIPLTNPLRSDYLTSDHAPKLVNCNIFRNLYANVTFNFNHSNHTRQNVAGDVSDKIHSYLSSLVSNIHSNNST